MVSLTMILLAALLCNYGRGKCLIIIGTEGGAPKTVARDEDEAESVTSDVLLERALLAVEDVLPPIEAGEYYYDEQEMKRWILGDRKTGNCEDC